MLSRVAVILGCIGLIVTGVFEISHGTWASAPIQYYLLPILMFLAAIAIKLILEDGK